jgi:Bacterial Ig domain/Flagellar filament outer layer protein Flaa
MRTRIPLVFVLFACVLLLVACGQGQPVSQAAPPSVLITEPVNGQQVQQDQELRILVTAVDAQGVTRLEVGVDGVLLYTLENPSPASNAPFAVQQTWTATTPGSHAVMAVAYNLAGVASNPVVANVVVTAAGGAPPPPQPTSSSPGGPEPTATWTPIVISSQESPAPPPQTVAPPPTPTATTKPPPSGSGTTRPAGPGLITDFEQFGTWKRGDQPNGTFTQSSEQAHSGSSSGKLAYSFPSGSNDFVVFLQSHLLGGQPNQISAWVYGDGSKHYLNVWIKDAKGETWQFPLGQVKHTGWQQMFAWLDAGAPWPAGRIDGPSNGTVDYPIDFRGLVLDDIPDSYSGSGVIYIDDLRCDQVSAPPPTPTPTSTTKPPPAEPSVSFRADDTKISSGDCTRLRWDVDNVDKVYLDGEPKVGHDKLKVCPTVTTTYTLKVVLRDGSVKEYYVTVEVV